MMPPRQRGPLSPNDAETMIYTVDLGDGTVAEVEGPPNATPEQLQSFMAQQQQGQPAEARTTPVEGGFADELPDQARSSMSPDDEQALLAMVRNGASAEDLRRAAAAKGFDFGNAEAVVAARDKTGQINPDVIYNLPKVETDVAGSLGRGVADSVLMGTLPKLGAAVGATEQALSGESSFGDAYNRILDQNNATIAADEESHPWARVSGQLLGGLALPAGMEGVGLQAGSDVLRAGGTMADARFAAKLAVRNRMAAVGGAYGAAHGAGSGDNISDAATGALAEGALGAATGGLLGQGGRSAKVDERVSTATQDAKNVFDAAQRQNVDILPQDLGSPLARRVTQGAAQTPFGSGPVTRAADQLYSSFQDRVASLGGAAQGTAEVGGAMKARSAELAAREGRRAEDTSAVVQRVVGTPDDMTGAGQIVQRGANQWMANTAERANQLYAQVPIPAASEAAVGSTRAMLRDLTAGMRSNPELGAMFDNPRLRGYLSALTPRVDEQTGEVLNEGRLSWQDLQDFRTRIGDMLDEPRLSEKIAPRQLRALYGALTQDMEATARNQGENALRAWRRANGYYAARMSRVNDTLAQVTGQRRDATPNEAIAKLQGMLRSGSTGDAASFGRIMRSLPTGDAATVRATLVNDARGGRQFDAAQLADRWSGLSERGKSALLPERGLRVMMDDAADRAAASTRDPLANLSSEQAFLNFERMANNRGDSARFRASLNAMSPEEASATRSLLIHRMGLANAGAQSAQGDAFSISKFLTRWNDMSDGAKATLFGDAEMRANMNDLALIAEKVKGSEKLAGHSNTGAINSFNATTGGLGGAALALLTGHPIVAAGLAGPALYQKATAELMTSKAMLKWLAKAPKKPNPKAQAAHIQRLTSIARAEPAIANEVLQLQQRLADAFTSAPARMAAEEPLNGVRQGQGNEAQQQGQQEGAEP